MGIFEQKMIKVYSKIELSQKLKNEIIKVLQKKYPDLKLEEVQFEKDKTIIAGIRIDVNSEVMDLTLNTRLVEIFSKLK